MDQNLNISSELKPRFCFEFLINGFHMMGQKNCPVCKNLPDLKS